MNIKKGTVCFQKTNVCKEIHRNEKKINAKTRTLIHQNC